MNLLFHTNNNIKITELDPDEYVITKVQDALDLIADADYNYSKRVIVHEKNLTQDFFNLRTGLAGEILQKCVNYQTKLAIVGDFSKYESESLKAFIRECNRGNQFFFVETKERAIELISLS